MWGSGQAELATPGVAKVLARKGDLVPDALRAFLFIGTLWLFADALSALGEQPLGPTAGWPATGAAAAFWATFFVTGNAVLVWLRKRTMRARVGAVVQCAVAWGAAAPAVAGILLGTWSVGGYTLVAAVLVGLAGALIPDAGAAYGLWGASCSLAAAQAAWPWPTELGPVAPFAAALPVWTWFLVAGAATAPMFLYLRRSRALRAAAGREQWSRGAPARMLSLVLVLAGLVGLSYVSVLVLARASTKEHNAAIASERLVSVFGVASLLGRNLGPADLGSGGVRCQVALKEYALASGNNLDVYRRGDVAAERSMRAMRASLGRDYDFVAGARREGTGFAFTTATPTYSPAMLEAIEEQLDGDPESYGDLESRLLLAGLPAVAHIGFAATEPPGGKDYASPRTVTGPHILVAYKTDVEGGAIPSSEIARWAAGAVLFPAGLALVFATGVTFQVLAKRDQLRHQLIQSEERARIAQDAHDKVYNRLAALSKRVELASDSISVEVGQSLGEVAADIRGTVADLQTILGDSRKAQAEVSGTDVLRTQLADICRAQGNRFGMQVAFEAPEVLPDVCPEAGWDLQCIVEEALTNAAKHGHAEHASVTVELPTDGTLRLTITDDGQGMDPVPDIDTLPESSTGLRGMRERVAKLGGTLCVTSKSGDTEVVVQVRTADAGTEPPPKKK